MDDQVHLTRDGAIDLMANANFQALQKEMNKIIEAERDKLLHELDPAKMVRLQERVLALRFASRFPEIISDREEIEDPTIITGG